MLSFFPILSSFRANRPEANQGKEKPERNLDHFFLRLGSDFETVFQYSVYELRSEEPTNRGYEYWNCINGLDSLSNNPKTVLPESLFHTETVLNDASDCFRVCDNRGFDVVTIANVPDDADNGSDDDIPFVCSCYARYRFSPSDLGGINCVERYCAGVRGPCVESPSQFSYAAVYCRGQEECGLNLLVAADQSGICEGQEGERAADTRLKAEEGEFVQCEHNIETDIWSWRAMSCAGDGQVFNGRECVLLVDSCQATDGRGVEWEAQLNTTAVKQCAESDPSLLGEMSWYCNERGFFEGSEPNRTDCREAWLDDIEDQVGNSICKPKNEVNRS